MCCIYLSFLFRSVLSPSIWNGSSAFLFQDSDISEDLRPVVFAEWPSVWFVHCFWQVDSGHLLLGPEEMLHPPPCPVSRGTGGCSCVLQWEVFESHDLTKNEGWIKRRLFRSFRVMAPKLLWKSHLAGWAGLLFQLWGTFVPQKGTLLGGRSCKSHHVHVSGVGPPGAWRADTHQATGMIAEWGCPPPVLVWWCDICDLWLFWDFPFSRMKWRQSFSWARAGLPIMHCPTQTRTVASRRKNRKLEHMQWPRLG